MNFSYASFSEIGPRSANEDAARVWALSPTCIAAAIADGLGGYKGGQQASAIAIETIGAAFNEDTPDLHSAVLRSHELIHQAQRSDPALRGMATTLSGIVIDNASARYVHCGDTRILLQRAKGIRRLTKDQTEAQGLLDAGLLTREEYLNYPRKNVLRSALGIPGMPDVEHGEFEVRRGDRILLTSDGVHSKVFAKEVLEMSLRVNTADQMVHMVQTVVEERDPEDNFTMVAIFCE